MRLFFRLIIILALLWLGYILFREAHAAGDAETTDPTKIVLMFAGVILTALVAGTILLFTILPMFAEKVSNVFFNPDTEVEKDPNSAAIAKMAMGDYQGAIDEYQKICEKNPSDTHALSEVARIYCDKLGDPDAAAGVLEGALEREWPVDQSAFLASRLTDIYWEYQHDADRAKAILEQIIGSAPGTKFAANATHRIHEIERAVVTGHLPPRKGPVAADDESPASPGDGEI